MQSTVDESKSSNQRTANMDECKYSDVSEKKKKLEKLDLSGKGDFSETD